MKNRMFNLKTVFFATVPLWAGKIWDWLKTRPAVWKERLGSVRRMRVENFEVVDFIGMMLFFLYLNTSWFNGQYTVALHRAIHTSVWLGVTGSIALMTLFGFLEEQYGLRRGGALGSFVLFFSVGIVSVIHYPHWLIGFLFLWASFTPFWLFTQVAVLKIKHEKRRDIVLQFQRTAKQEAPELSISTPVQSINTPKSISIPAQKG